MNLQTYSLWGITLLKWNSYHEKSFFPLFFFFLKSFFYFLEASLIFIAFGHTLFSQCTRVEVRHLPSDWGGICYWEKFFDLHLDSVAALQTVHDSESLYQLT